MMIAFNFQGSVSSLLYWSIQPHLAMHIPDGFLSLPVILFTWIVSLCLIALSLKQAEAEYKERVVPLMGVCAAFIFAAQMINFPIPGGTSGHLLGGTLAGILLGPWAGTLVVSVVFIVQAIFFQDGGLTVLGANIFNMGLIGTFGGYYVYKAIRFSLGRNRWRAMLIATVVASWLSVVLASLMAAIELSLSGTVPLIVAIIAMVSWHIIIGIGEALITVVAVNFIWRTRPDLLFDSPHFNDSKLISYQRAVRNVLLMTKKNRIFIFSGLGIAILIAFFLSPFASQNPDGLDRVAQDIGFDKQEVKNPPAKQLPFSHLFDGYTVKGVPPSVATPLAGLVGTLATFGIAWGVSKLVIRKPISPNKPEKSIEE